DGRVELEILRVAAHHRKTIHLYIFPKHAAAPHNGVRREHATLPKFRAFLNNGIRPRAKTRPDFRGRMDDGGGMNHGFKK
ncbi:MAG: hypothetical protein ACRETL_12950, partial [Gammaproteobacteria bacterium]